MSGIYLCYRTANIVVVVVVQYCSTNTLQSRVWWCFVHEKRRGKRGEKAIGYGSFSSIIPLTTLKSTIRYDGIPFAMQVNIELNCAGLSRHIYQQKEVFDSLARKSSDPQFLGSNCLQCQPLKTDFILCMASGDTMSLLFKGMFQRLDEMAQPNTHSKEVSLPAITFFLQTSLKRPYY